MAYTPSMRGLSALQKTLQLLPIRGKGRLADIIFQALKPEETECHPLREVTVFLRPSQRIERLMWGGAYERDLVALFKRALKPGLTHSRPILQSTHNVRYPFLRIYSTVLEGAARILSVEHRSHA